MPRSDVRILLKMGALALSNVYLDSSSKVHQTVQSHTTVTMVASIKKLKNVFVKLAVIRVTKMSKTLGSYQNSIFISINILVKKLYLSPYI